MIHRLLPTLTAAALLAVAHTSFAADPTTAQKETAKDLYKKALAANAHRDYEQAAALFQRSYELGPHQLTLWNWAMMELNAHHSLEGLKLLKRYMADPHAESAKKAEGQGYIAKLYAETGHLKVTAPTGTLLAVDDVVLADGATSDIIDVTAGKHSIRAGAGDTAQRKDVDATPGVETAVTFEAPKTATIVAPPPPERAPEPPPIAPPPDKGGTGETSGGIHAPPTATWIFLGGAVAAAGVGVGFALVSNSKHDDYLRDRNACAVPSSAACSAANDARDAGKRDATISYVGYGLAGAALVGGVISWALAPSEKAPRVSGMVLPGAGGVRVQGAF